MAGKNSVDHLRRYRIFIAHDSREQIVAALNMTDQIIAEFVLDRPLAEFGLRERALAKCAESAG
jgi:hypothetical protein